MLIHLANRDGNPQAIVLLGQPLITQLADFTRPETQAQCQHQRILHGLRIIVHPWQEKAEFILWEMALTFSLSQLATGVTVDRAYVLYLACVNGVALRPGQLGAKIQGNDWSTVSDSSDVVMDFDGGDLIHTLVF
jgi:hypothetical protein